MTSQSTSESAARVPALKATDRCDRCGAQAYFQHTHRDNGNQLLWCAHHKAEYGPALTEKFAITVDDSWVLAPGNRAQGVSY